MKQKLLSILALTLCLASSMMAIPQTDGVYQIGTAQDLVDFAAGVSDGTIAANASAVLTDDITLSGTWTTPIGTSTTSYTGTFDGQGHAISGFSASSAGNGGLFGKVGENATIKNFSISGSLTVTGSKYSGVIGQALKSTITNIHSYLAITVIGGDHVGGVVGSAEGSSGTNISGCSFSGSINVSVTGNHAGIVGYISNDLVQNCANYGTITFSNTNCAAGGIVGYINSTSAQVKNCLNTGSMVSSGGTPKWGGAIVGRLRGHTVSKLTNNYWLGTSATGAGKDNDGKVNLTTATSVTAEQLATGEICYGLNGSTNGGTAWRQNLSTNVDANPVPNSTHEKVYLYKTSYINDGEDLEIADAADLNNFATIVNAGAVSVNAELTRDITLDGGTWNPIGKSSAYIGTFDGKGYTISNLTYPANQNNYGLFGIVDAGAVIKDFTVSGDITNPNNKDNIGVIGKASGTSVSITDVHSNLNITSNVAGKKIGGVLGYADTGTINIDRCTYSGTLSVEDTGNGGNYGGIVGYIWNSLGAIVHISNCLFDGTVQNTSESPGGCCFGGIVGYIGANVSKYTIKNTLSKGTVSSGADNVCGMYFGIVRHKGNGFSNNYYSGDKSTWGTASNTATELTEATSVDAGQLASGEICYALNGSINGGTNWYQTLTGDTPDLYPIPSNTSKRVYYKASTPNYINFDVSEDKIQISSASILKDFADVVNAGGTTLNAELTGDINMSDVEITVIGNSPTNAYKGTFDGNGYEINNYSLTIDGTFVASYGYGMFGNTNGATIKNFTIDGDMTFSGSGSGDFGGGLVGWPDGGTSIQNIKSSINIDASVYSHFGGIVGSLRTATVDRCEYAGTLDGKASGNGVAGIAGYTNNGTITNCIFSGTVKGTGTGYYAGILGYVNNANANIQNCLSYGSVNNTKSSWVGTLVSRLRNIGTYSNNYYKGTKGIGGGEKENDSSIVANTIQATDEDLESGEVAYKLGAAWYQTIGTNATPVLTDSSDQVLYVGAAGYSTMYDADNDWALVSSSGDAKAYIGTLTPGGTGIHLDEIDDIPAGTAVVIGGTYYNKVSIAATATTTGNILLGSDGTIKGGNGIYALAKKSDVVGFYPVDSSVTIPAGKAYLDVNAPSGSGEVKVFTFVFDDDDATGIESIQNSKFKIQNEDAIYNLAGQRISRMQRGINIVNGKKIMK